MLELQKHILVSCAIIERDNRVLAVQRSSVMSMPLMWEFPGGKIERGETPEECLKREIIEELGIKIITKAKLPPSAHSYPEFVITLQPYICSIKSGEIVLREHSAMAWLPPWKLRSLKWTAADLPIIELYLEKLKNPKSNI